MQQDSFFVKHSKAITIVSLTGIIFCILLIIAVSLLKFFSRSTYLTVQFAPASAELTIYNQDLILQNGTYELPPGTYTGTLTADGFKPKEVTINVDPHQVNSFTDYIMNSSEGFSYFEKSATDISTLHQIANQNNYNNPELSAFLEAYDHKASIYNLLPLQVSWYKYPNDTPMYTVTISNATNYSKCNGTLCLLITGPADNRTEITKSLSEQGYDINDYEVFYEYNAI